MLPNPSFSPDPHPQTGLTHTLGVSTMLTKELLASLVYVDREFVTGRYEITSGQSPSTQFTKTQSKKAGAGIQVFSAEISALETRSFGLSSLEMLATVLPNLQEEPTLAVANFERRMFSKQGWVEGFLSTLTVAPFSRNSQTGEETKGPEQPYFTLDNKLGLKLAFITTPDYFASGIESLLKAHKVLTMSLDIPVRAYVRVIAAQAHLDQWVAIPLVILERRDA